MDYQKDEQVIYFKDLIFVALYQWRRILAFGIVLALVLGGFMGIRSWKAYTATAGTISEAQKSYEEALKEYQAQLEAIEAEQQNTIHALDAAAEALGNSPLAAYDAYSVYTAYAVYTATVEDTFISAQGVLQDKTHTVMQSYHAMLAGDKVLKPLAQALDIEERYVNDVLVAIYDPDAKTLSISLSFPSAQKASQGLAVVNECLADAHTHISNVTAKHTLNLVVEDIQNTISKDLLEQQTEQKKNCEALLERLTELKDAAASLVKPAAPEQLSKKSVIKDAILFGVIGAVLGAFVAVAMGWVSHLAGNKVYSGRTLYGRTHMEVIATMPSGKGNALDLWLQKLENRTVGKDSEAVCAGLLSQYCAKDSKVQLLYCDIPIRAELDEALGEKFCSAQANSLMAVQQLSDCDSVVLIAQCHYTRYDTVKQQAKQLNALGKKLVGCVLIDG